MRWQGGRRPASGCVAAYSCCGEASCKRWGTGGRTWRLKALTTTAKQRSQQECSRWKRCRGPERSRRMARTTLNPRGKAGKKRGAPSTRSDAKATAHNETLSRTCGSRSRLDISGCAQAWYALCACRHASRTCSDCYQRASRTSHRQRTPRATKPPRATFLWAAAALASLDQRRRVVRQDISKPVQKIIRKYLQQKWSAHC